MEILIILSTVAFGCIVVAWMWNTRQLYKQQEESMKRCYKILEGKDD